MAFGLAFLKQPGQYSRKSAQLTTIFIWAAGILGVLMERPFPMDPRGSAATFAGTMHIVAAGLCSLAIMLALLFGARAFTSVPGGRGYALYSYITLAIVFLTGALAATSAATGSALMGLAERVTIGAFLQWVFLVALRHLSGVSGRRVRGRFFDIASKNSPHLPSHSTAGAANASRMMASYCYAACCR